MPTPAENGSVPATGNERPYYSDGLVEEAVATDLNHLYALQLRCTSTDPGSCGRVLYGSEDGGRTWTQRKPGSPYQLRVLAPGVLGGLSMTSPTSAVARYSSDGGRTWKDTELASGTIAAVPRAAGPRAAKATTAPRSAPCTGWTPRPERRRSWRPSRR